LRKMQKKHDVLMVLLTALVLAFALGVLVYVGGAILQTVNITHIPEPRSALSSALLGAILGIIGNLIARNKYNKES
jgi:H+/Cl- antiporter ClcA